MSEAISAAIGDSDQGIAGLAHTGSLVAADIEAQLNIINRALRAERGARSLSMNAAHPQDIQVRTATDPEAFMAGVALLDDMLREADRLARADEAESAGVWIKD